MSRRRTKKEEIRNPEHYFNRYISLEKRRDEEAEDEYYEKYPSLDEMQDNLELSNGRAQLLTAINIDGNDFDRELSEKSALSWIDNIENPWLLKAVKQLPIRDQYLITYRYKFCHTQKETAALLSVSQAAISYKERTIKKFLKKNLKNPYKKS